MRRHSKPSSMHSLMVVLEDGFLSRVAQQAASFVRRHLRCQSPRTMKAVPQRDVLSPILPLPLKNWLVAQLR